MARVRFDVEKQITALNSPQADTSALGLLNLLAVLQWKEARPGDFSGSLQLDRHRLVAPAINSYHNRDVRKRLEKEVPKLVSQEGKGSLPHLYNALDDVEERQKDLTASPWAKAEFAGAEQEILDMEAASLRETQAPTDRPPVGGGGVGDDRPDRGVRVPGHAGVVNDGEKPPGSG